jgi:hypothetical protein
MGTAGEVVDGRERGVLEARGVMFLRTREALLPP